MVTSQPVSPSYDAIHSTSEKNIPVPPPRNVAVDAYRGLVMVLMMGEVMRFADTARAFPQSTFWRILAYNQTHVEWAGMSLHDTIQPGFTFLAGVALPYSIRSRQRKGESFPRMLFHTMWRSLLLIALGIFLRSTDRPITYYTFEDTLSQIGLGYTFAFLLTFVKARWQWISLAGILFAYWLAWALYPAPGPNFNWAAVGVPPDWHHIYNGFAAHWNKNSNFGNAFDVWFLNLFPRTSRFAFNEGGYLTLSFIPTLGTMLLGVIAGRWFREAAPRIPLRKFAIAAGNADGGRIVAALHWHLPNRQAHLDAVMDALERRSLLRVPRILLLAHRRQEKSEVGISACGRGHELDRRILHRAPLGRVHLEYLQDSPRDAVSEYVWGGAGAFLPRRAHHGGVLVDSLLDVPQADLHPYLTISRR